MDYKAISDAGGIGKPVRVLKEKSYSFFLNVYKLLNFQHYKDLSIILFVLVKISLVIIFMVLDSQKPNTVSR